MAIISWNESYSVKVFELDQQHKKWLSIINDLHDAMLEGKGRDQLANTFRALEDYTRIHFTAEENYLSNAHYPEFAAHKKLHESFNDKLEAIRDKNLAEDNILMSVEVLNELRDWLLNHIKNVDKNYSDFLNSNGIS
jgi:hemerythrin